MICSLVVIAAGLAGVEDSSSPLALTATALLLPSMVQSAGSTGQTDRFQYDALGRLIDVSTEVDSTVQSHVTYSYDAAGNRTQLTTTSTTTPPSAHVQVVVLPLAGFTVIPIQTTP